MAKPFRAAYSRSGISRVMLSDVQLYACIGGYTFDNMTSNASEEWRSHFELLIRAAE